MLVLVLVFLKKSLHQIFLKISHFLTFEKDHINHLNHYSFFKFCLKNVTEYTGGRLDLEIVGPGYFELYIEESKDYLYSRSGMFKIQSGKIVCQKTHLPLSLDFEIPDQHPNLKINSSGEVSVWLEKKQKRQKLGSIKLATFENPSELNYLGDKTFYPSDASGNLCLQSANTLKTGFIRQGFVDHFSYQLLNT